MTDPRLDNVRDAIRVMTAWADAPDGSRFMSEQVMSILQESDDESFALLNLSLGLSNLCGYLLVMREADTGATLEETLQEIARRIA
ncbi:hypothetical protein [Phycicoccus duodecadis]|uniref:Uncharacterized protein n=1 Tax=Phycicoccus duodecadis TaxID=173053 RepID=A0A2N3YF21_9MICO|nr:hypothetical protein [Phycicoccus duodecadis]PKW25400.1 hypothetical protein ATL31_0188 [Phycicoccus duodecadis]